MTSENIKSEFEIITGSTNVILVAPHGYPGDDDNTGQLARLLAEKLNCNAIINEVYRKPKDDEITDFDKKIVNLNKLNTYKKNKALYNSFVGPIKDSVKQSVDKHKKAFVFHIHGIDDPNIETVDKELEILLGIGLTDKKKEKNRYTLLKGDVEKLLELLNGVRLNTQTTKHNDYAGWSKHNLNQLFQKDVEEVSSVQLEIKKTGCRDNNNNIKELTNKLAKIITGFIKSVDFQIPPVETIDEYKTIKNVLLIAPNAHPHDGKNIGAVVKVIQNELPEQINCQVIVNEKYRLPKEIRTIELIPVETVDEDGKKVVRHQKKLNIKLEKINKDKGIIDWRSYKHAKKLLKKELLGPLEEFANLPGNKLIMWINGISPDQIMCDSMASQSNISRGQYKWEKSGFVSRKLFLFGRNTNEGLYGDGSTGRECNTMDKDQLTKFLAHLTGNQIKQLKLSNAKSSNYNGSLKDDMNQWFRLNGHSLPETQSFQLYVRNIGFRDTEENIEKTGKMLAQAMTKVCLPVKELSVDEQLVAKAKEDIIRIFSEGAEKAILKTGNYLVENFFDKNISRARDDKPFKHKSLSQLIKSMKTGVPYARSRAWYYRSIQLVVEYDDIKNKLPKSVYTYRHLLLSHKVLLFPVKDLKLKEQLIAEIDENNYTVYQLRDRLIELRLDEPNEVNTVDQLRAIINRPGQLFSEKNAHLRTPELLSSLPDNVKEEFQKEAADKLQQMNRKIEKQTQQMQNYRSLIQLFGVAKLPAPPPENEQ